MPHDRAAAEDRLLEMPPGHGREITADERRVLMEHGRVHAADKHHGHRLAILDRADGQHGHAWIRRPGDGIASVAPHGRSVGDAQPDLRRAGRRVRRLRRGHDAVFQAFEVARIGIGNRRVGLAAKTLRRRRAGMGVRGRNHDVGRGYARRRGDPLSCPAGQRLGHEDHVGRHEQHGRRAGAHIERRGQQGVMHTGAESSDVRIAKEELGIHRGDIHRGGPSR